MKAFGSGLGFPMRSNDGMIIPDSGKSNPRADSFSLYLNFVANQMLSNLLPKSKIDNKLQKISRGDKLVKAQSTIGTFGTPSKIPNTKIQPNSLTPFAQKGNPLNQVPKTTQT
jgi:hypothetical protein